MKDNSPPQYLLSSLLRHARVAADHFDPAGKKPKVVDSVRLLKKDLKKLEKVYFQISNIWKYESCTCSIDL